MASALAADLVLPVSGKSRKRDDEEPIVYCGWDGTWWAGRYVGSITFEGHTLVIEPRFGLPALRSWLSEATSVVLAQSPGHLRADGSFIVQLLASIWVHGFVEAARHGLPALRREAANKGPTIRGRLDVTASLELMMAGGHQVVSIRSERSLDHAASDAIVAAYAALRRWIGGPDEAWMPARARQLMPELLAITGARPPVPTKAELARIRYTPITAGFAPVAELSRQIATRAGMTASVEADGSTKGVLLDVAELWELYVLSVVRKAASPLSVTHGTREAAASRKLLYSQVTGQGLGTLIPDAILHAGNEAVGVVDAKYKTLQPSASAPAGVQREDLYQMAAYLGRFAPADDRVTAGFLVYPEPSTDRSASPAEQFGPWILDSKRRVIFATLPHIAAEAITKMRGLLATLSA